MLRRLSSTQSIYGRLNTLPKRNLPQRRAYSANNKLIKQECIDAGFDHTSFFTNTKTRDGSFTPVSLYSAFKELGDGTLESFFKAGILTLKGSGCPFNPSTAGILTHPRSLNLYVRDNERGLYVNEDNLNKLIETCSEEHDGVMVIPKSKFYAYLEKNHKEDNESDLLGLGKLASNREWGGTWGKIVDHWKGDEPCITAKGMREFIMNSHKVFEKIKNGELPIKKEDYKPNPRSVFRPGTGHANE